MNTLQAIIAGPLLKRRVEAQEKEIEGLKKRLQIEKDRADKNYGDLRSMRGEAWKAQRKLNRTQG